MGTWQSSNVAANGIYLHITRTGGTKPPLVLVHGVTDDGLCWSPVAKSLSLDYDIVMVDARGHGHSDAPNSGYDLLTLVNDLYGVIGALGLNQPVIMGHSLGAATTLVLAGMYPETPRAIVLEDPPGWWVQQPAAQFSAIAEGIKTWAAQLKSKTHEQILAEGRTQNPRWSEAELAPWADSKMSLSPNAIAQLFSQDHLASLDWAGCLRQIACPVLVVTADLAQGAALTPAGVEALRALVPQAQEKHIAGAGHSIRRDQLALYLKAVRAFLADVPEASGKELTGRKP